MKLYLLCFALFIVLWGFVIQQLGAEQTQSWSEKILGPVAQTAWRTGLMGKVAFKSFDDLGYKMPRPFMTHEHLAKVKDLLHSVSENEFVISTFWKCGTHLMMQVGVQLLGNGTSDFDNIHSQILFLDTVKLDCADGPIIKVDNYREMRPRKTLPVVTHFPTMLVPVQPSSKYAVMVRNPVDAFASMHTHTSKRFGVYAPTLDILYKTFFKGEDVMQGGYGWAEFYRDWWVQSQVHENVLFLFYEDVVQNIEPSLWGLAQLLGVSATPELLERVRHRSSFKYMKAQSRIFEPPKCTSGGAQVDMVNKGIAGGGKASVSPALLADMKAYYHRVFDGTGFPVERYEHVF